MSEYKHERIEECETESIKVQENEGMKDWKPESPKERQN